MIEEKSQREYKSNLLLEGLRGYGYNKTNKISQNELFLFLDLKSPNNKFDPYLSEKLSNILKINERTVISIEYFISKFLEFDEEIRKDAEDINSKYILAKESYNNILEECEKYKTEKVNNEGFSEDGKLYGEILDINLKEKFEGIQEIILKMVYSGQEFTISQNYELFNINESHTLNKPFEFKANTKKDNLIIILQGKNELGDVSDLASKEYSLLGLSTQDSEILLKAELTEKNQNENENISAEINVKLAMHGSNSKYFEGKRKIEEEKLNQIESDLKNVGEYLKRINLIYGEQSTDSDIYMEKEKRYKEAEIQQNNNIINKESIGASVGRYVVMFNNMRIIDSEKKGNKKESIKGFQVDFKNKINFVEDKNENLINNIQEKKENKKEENENEKVSEEENETINQEKSIGSFVQKENNENEEENKNIENNEQNNEKNSENNEPLDENEKEEENKELNHSQNIKKSQNLNENMNMNEMNYINNNEANNYNDIYNNNIDSLFYNKNQNIEKEYISKNEIDNLQQNNMQMESNIQNQNYNSMALSGNKNINININRNYPMVHKPVVNERKNKVIIQEKILPIKYLPEKVNKAIIENSINTLPVIQSQKNVTYKNNTNINSHFGINNPNRNNLGSMLYQTQMINNNNYNMSFQPQMTRNNQAFMSYQGPNF